MRQKAEDPDPVVEADDNDSLPCQLPSVIQGIGGGAANESATVDVHHNWAMRLGVIRGSPDTHRQAILASLLPRRNDIGPLHAVIPEMAAIANPLPRNRRLWRPPAQGANRRRGEWDALEGYDA